MMISLPWCRQIKRQAASPCPPSRDLHLEKRFEPQWARASHGAGAHCLANNDGPNIAGARCARLPGLSRAFCWNSVSMIMQPTRCRSSTTGQRPSLAMTRAIPSSRSSRPFRQNSGSSRRRRNFRSISCGTITISTACSNAPRCRRSSARPTITRKKLINVALVAVCLVFPFALTGDYAYAEWGNKPVAFVGCGGLGGDRAVEQLRLHAVEVQMVPIRSAIHILFPDWPTPPSASDTPGAQALTACSLVMSQTVMLTRPPEASFRPRTSAPESAVQKTMCCTGEYPPYGMIGGIEETSASFEARSAPRSYPTAGRGE
jgi:hypothetical protein